MGVRKLLAPKSNNEKITQYTWNIIKLFNRCDQMKVLPKIGGLNDQNEKVMLYFDMIRDEYNRHQKESVEREERLREAKARLKRG